MKVLAKTIRSILKVLLLCLDRLFPVRVKMRTPEELLEIAQRTQGWVLYEFLGCPFCIKVRRHLRKISLKIETREASLDPHRSNLISGGGSFQVPCLLWKDREDREHWMYESSDIIEFLNKEFPCNVDKSTS